VTAAIEATIQLCTYNRARVLERVLDACFEQTISGDAYEVVLVDDGSSDETPAVIARAHARATCAFTVVSQANAGLAKARNAGIARARGERIIFIDDDVLPLPNFVAEHLRAAERMPHAVVRGGAIEVAGLDDLPPPVWSLRHYSGNRFWTTNVSAPLATIRAIGGFDESFTEYGWEDIDVGLRLRARGVPAILHPAALVYHYKPPLRVGDVERMVRQARAQARTAVRLVRKHPGWRAHLATGVTKAQRIAHALLRASGAQRRAQELLARLAPETELRGAALRAARTLRALAYYDELERALHAAR
jgi:glycosyltransferase involved in cell wall biosynthesis